MWQTDNKQNKYVKYIICQIMTTTIEGGLFSEQVNLKQRLKGGKGVSRVGVDT